MTKSSAVAVVYTSSIRKSLATSSDKANLLFYYMRISGITIPDNKHLEYGLTEVYGIGRTRAQDILRELDIKEFTKPKKEKKRVSFIEDVEVPMLQPQLLQQQQPVPQTWPGSAASAAANAKLHQRHVVGHSVVVGVVGNVCY